MERTFAIIKPDAVAAGQHGVDDFALPGAECAVVDRQHKPEFTAQLAHCQGKPGFSVLRL